jgi:AcrR family transcriptional regulator
MVTEKLLAHFPISAITTRDIARGAEVSDGVLYNYFDDKNQLILAALVRRYADLAARFDAEVPVAGTSTVEANLTACSNALLELLSEGLPTMAGLLSEPALLHGLIAEIHRQPLSPQYLQARMGDYLRDEQSLGRLSAEADPAAVATLLMGSAIVMNLTGLLTALPAGSVQADQIRAIIATLLRGVAPD